MAVQIQIEFVSIFIHILSKENMKNFSLSNQQQIKGYKRVDCCQQKPTAAKMNQISHNDQNWYDSSQHAQIKADYNIQIEEQANAQNKKIEVECSEEDGQDEIQQFPVQYQVYNSPIFPQRLIGLTIDQQKKIVSQNQISNRFGDKFEKIELKRLQDMPIDEKLHDGLLIQRSLFLEANSSKEKQRLTSTEPKQSNKTRNDKEEQCFTRFNQVFSNQIRKNITQATNMELKPFSTNLAIQPFETNKNAIKLNTTTYKSCYDQSQGSSQKIDNKIDTAKLGKMQIKGQIAQTHIQNVLQHPAKEQDKMCLSISSQNPFQGNKTKNNKNQLKLVREIKIFQPFQEYIQQLKDQFAFKQPIYEEDDDDHNVYLQALSLDIKNLDAIKNFILVQPKSLRRINQGEKTEEYVILMNRSYQILEKQTVKNMPTILKLTNEQTLTGKYDSKQTSLGNLIAYVLRVNYIRKNVFNHLMGQLINKVYQLCDSILASLPERQLNAYAQIVTELKNDTSNRLRTQKFRQYNPQGLTIKSAFKLDLLSYFFKKNYEKLQQYGYQITPIMELYIIGKFFQINSVQVRFYRDKFDELYNWIDFEYSSIFDDLISLIYLLDLKRKIIVKMYDYNKTTFFDITRKETFKQKAKLNPNIRSYKYKYCQLVYLYAGRPINIISSSTKAQIIESIKSIIKMDSLEESQQKFIKTKMLYNVSLKDLSEMEWGFRNNDRNIIDKFQKHINLRQNLEKCKWLFLKQDNFSRAIKNATGLAFQEQQLYVKNVFFLKTFLKMAIERFQLYDKILDAQINVIERYTPTKFIYIHRLYYSYDELRKYFGLNSQSEQSEQKKDEGCTLIVGAIHNQVYFYSFLKTKINDRDYNKIIKTVFNKYLKPKFSFNIILYEFTIESGCYKSKYCKQLRQQFKGNFKANVYIANSPKRFGLHFKVDYILKSWFRDNAHRISTSTFYKQISLKIMQTLMAIRKLSCYDQP